jgi:predicted ATP-dependent endonuclease of OLD family
MDEVSIEVIAEALYNEYYNVKRKISVKIYNALFETFALAIDEEKVGEIEIPDNIVEIIQENQTRLIEALEDAPENEFKEMVIQRIDTLTINDKDHFQRNKLFTQLLLQMVQELEQEKEELGILNILIQVFNSMLSEGKEIIMDREGINIKVNGSTHGLNELSSGERHLLTFLTIILLDGYSRDIIFIDEPEISLNILWQEKLIDLITRLAPNTQIIVASHSQSIVSGHTNSLVEIEKRHLS